MCIREKWESKAGKIENFLQRFQIKNFFFFVSDRTVIS